MLASVHIYPLKGCRAVDLDHAVVEPWGLAGDRRWLLVDADCQFITQREHPALARLVVGYGAGADIAVSCDGYPPLRVAAPGGCPELLKVTVWRSTVLAAAAGPEADAWFSAYLGQPVRLVWLDDPTRRGVNPEYGQEGDVVSFADGYPLLLTTTGSLDQLGRWLTEAGDQPVPMNRFRGHHDRPDDRRARQATAADARPPPPVRQEPDLRAEPHPRLPRPDPGRRSDGSNRIRVDDQPAR
jgi:uncharacterized protein YcbX